MLTTFRNLRNVTVRAESVVSKEYTVDTGRIDADLLAVQKDFFDLLFNKDGASIEKMVFVVEGYCILLPQKEDEDGLRSLTRDLRIFHCDNTGKIGPIVHEETLPSSLDISRRLWELDMNWYFVSLITWTLEEIYQFNYSVHSYSQCARHHRLRSYTYWEHINRTLHPMETGICTTEQAPTYSCSLSYSFFHRRWVPSMHKNRLRCYTLRRLFMIFSTSYPFFLKLRNE